MIPSAQIKYLQRIVHQVNVFARNSLEIILFALLPSTMELDFRSIHVKDDSAVQVGTVTISCDLPGSSAPSDSAIRQLGSIMYT